MAKKTKTNPPLSPAAAEKQTKVAASKRQIQIELTAEQMDAFTNQYKKLNPSEAAELVFTFSKKPTSKLKIAGYSYHGDSCCV
ncbi:hypothetical protein SAMN05428988_5662 [Chitinophaga sp. YR573]|uniref:hypothetical protein n=1 Tax=Chitinophaga sp. YR573 TaxID=1881040 RepID=UPI0008C36D43|nr:hypothetical protein [Chitinophaga sp. YR573]SEW43944.1 hypothetical protein SAMN05428988_5662 [Chitinophaga sp. YR573]